MSVMQRNVKIEGKGQRAMMFAHGFGCDQNMWRLVEPAFRNSCRAVEDDHDLRA